MNCWRLNSILQCFCSQDREGCPVPLCHAPPSPVHRMKWCNGHGSWVMGHGSCGSCINCVMDHTSHGSRKMTHFHSGGQRKRSVWSRRVCNFVSGGLSPRTFSKLMFVQNDFWHISIGVRFVKNIMAGRRLTSTYGARIEAPHGTGCGKGGFTFCQWVYYSRWYMSTVYNIAPFTSWVLLITIETSDMPHLSSENFYRCGKVFSFLHC